MIIRRDFNIYPSLYEDTVCRIPGISETVLIGIWNEAKEDEDIVLCVRADDRIGPDGISAYVMEALRT
jgi:acyl-CoA synthetase (AMP-forming)/AMP-acid ligase II